jgi:PAS domain S-box-containing protein
VNLAKARILAIDDTPVNLLSLGAMLSNEFDLQIAVSGAEGLKLAAQTTPDLVLLDIMMPGMDGYEVCQRLKEDPVLRDIPVVFVTALTEADSEARGLALGAADYISKPINVEIARHRIRNLLERERLRKQIKSQYEILQEQIAQREQAQSALRESEELFRAVSESANDAIVTSNSLGDIVTWNGGAQRIFGYMQQEAVGARLTMLMPQRLHAPHLAGMQRVLSGGQRHVMGQPVELIGRRKDGGEFPLELSLAH